jgi:endonuclease/exonuclease/phosphatase family metal-dependent hydrolase
VAPNDRRREREEQDLRIANFNVENMHKADTYFYGKEKWTKAQVDGKVAWVANQLRLMNAGLVGFEEVWDAPTLRRAIDASGVYTTGELISFGADGSGPTVALWSAYPVLEKHTIVNFPPEAVLSFEGVRIPITKWSRPVIKAVVEIPTGDRMAVFVVHLKSKRPIVDGEKRHDQQAVAIGTALALVQRAAEAAALRWLLVQEMANNHRPVVLVGDLNDVVHSVSGEIITGATPWRKLAHEQKEKIWDVLLWSTNEIQVRNSDRDVTYSHIFNGRYEVLDHVMVSQEFNRANPGHTGYVMYLQIFNDHLTDETLSDVRRDGTKSDHGQVVAHIKLYPRGNTPKTLRDLDRLAPEGTVPAL